MRSRSPGGRTFLETLGGVRFLTTEGTELHGKNKTAVSQGGREPSSMRPFGESREN